jgi:hypothetical protein
MSLEKVVFAGLLLQLPLGHFEYILWENPLGTCGLSMAAQVIHNMNKIKIKDCYFIKYPFNSFHLLYEMCP